ncbi:Aste57867_16046 [Aphanomyces stellatus]|uniref:Aste57867_16046 protein n=1 Tax=Aphanomyces stellatus TaxID=120398 RepID=A0A485L4J4_9STRA|nr:hypothetical protein As57867_015990 [Aphanomyces stellatus]VFT92830.1 Aste57867_16046 [Aphanomyces stellatus]
MSAAAELTVVYGKQQAGIVVTAVEGSKISIKALKALIEPLFGTPSAGQKLLFRGKELKDGATLDLATLPSKPKVMLLYHGAKIPARTTGMDSSAAEATIPAAAPPTPIVPDAIEVLEHQCLVQVVRGKERHRFALDKTSTVQGVKEHVAHVMGVPARFQRLLCKGKYPPDDVTLSSLPAPPVFMLLYDEQHHVRMEVKQTTAEMQQQLVDYAAQLSRIRGQMARNFFDVTDLGLQLRQLLDAVEILHSNAEISFDTAASDELRRLAADALALQKDVAAVQATLITRRT